MSKNESWPGLPDGPGTILLSDIEIDQSLEVAVIMLHGGFNEFRKKMTEVCNNQNYANTGWLDSIDTALAAPPSTKILDSIANLKPGMAYKATFLTSAMGSMCQTTEIGRVVEYIPDKTVILDGTICTAAKYGETFRPVTRRTFEVLGPSRTRIKTEGAVAFISSVNGMIKGMIQKGSIQGMRDTFAKMETIISESAKVQPYQEAGGVTLGLPPSPAVVTAATKEPSPLRNVLETFVGTTAIEALDPWASFLYAALAHLPFLGGMTSDTVLCAIVALLSFEIVRACLLVLKFCASAGRHPQDTLSWASYYIFKYIHVPQSVHEVFTTVAIALFAREMMAKFASFIPQPPSGGSRPPSAAGNHGGAGVGEDSEGQGGVKYDGYGKAIAGKNNNYVEKGTKPLGALDDKSEVALEHIRQGLVNIGKLGQSNRARARQQRQEKHEKIVEKMQERRQKHAKNKQPGVIAAVETVLDDAEIAAAAAADWAEGSTTTKTATAAGAGAVRSGMSSPLSGGGEFGLSPRSPTALQYDAEEAALLEDPHNLSTEGYSGPELSPQLRSAAVVESLFENERLQPFRGWGHTWPGHFLPTDRVLHWSMNDPGQEPDSVCSQSIKEVAPLPPPGWRWVEPAWHLDLSGVFSDSTDNDGWSYGLDFPWVVYPFVPGTGRKKMADFVRRRRWLRTRVPVFKFAAPAETEVEGALEGESSSIAAAEGSEEKEGTAVNQNGAASGESGGSSSSSSSSTGGGVAEALQQSISRPFGSAVEELELRPSEEVAEEDTQGVTEPEKGEKEEEGP